MKKADCIRVIDHYVGSLCYHEFGSGDGFDVNCLGLVRKFLRDHLGIADPFPWPGDVPPGSAGAALHQYFQRVTIPEVGDVALMDGRHGEGMHVGIYIPNGSSRGVLHASSVCGVIWQPTGELTIRAYYRHREAC